MLETSARVLRLLSLLHSRRDWSGAELAERLDVTTRTVRRDIDRLRGLGYPVASATGIAERADRSERPAGRGRRPGGGRRGRP